MEIEIKKVTGWFGVKEKNGLIENPDKDNINKSDVVLVVNNSGETREIILFDSNSKEKKRIKITDKQSIKLQKETTDKISGLVQCIGLVK